MGPMQRAPQDRLYEHSHEVGVCWIQIFNFQMTKSQPYNGASKLILCSSVALMSTTNPHGMSFRAQSGAEIYFWEWKKANLGQIHPFALTIVHQKKLQIYCFKTVLFCSKNKFKISHVMEHNAVRLVRILFFQWSFWKKFRSGHVLGNLQSYENRSKFLTFKSQKLTIKIKPGSWYFLVR